MKLLELLEAESDAALAAKKKGLVSVGYGKWADKRSGKTVARTVDGKLTPIKPGEENPPGDKQPANGEAPPTAKKSSGKPQPQGGGQPKGDSAGGEKQPPTKDGKPQQPATAKEPPTKMTPQDFPDTPEKQASSKLMDLLPKSTIDMTSNFGKIRPEDRMRVSAMLDKLKAMADDAKSKGENAPNYDLCQVSIPGTNLFCGGNKGIPRIEMPQFKGDAAPGSIADKLPRDSHGEVDADAMFQKMLGDQGVKMVTTKIPADRLKSTQNQLVGAKVAGMTAALNANPTHPALTAPIYVSRDGYVLDGHHRWAAVVGTSLKQGKPMNMNVRIVDMDIDKLLPMANAYAKKIGIVQKGG